MKYALIMCFCYPRSIYGESKISPLFGALSDIRMITLFCKTKGILPEHITIITDINEVCGDASDCNVKYLSYPSGDRVCRELSQFVENTIRGIEDDYHKSETNIPEILLYMSGHGTKINITIPEKRNDQAFVLLDDDGSIKYLTTKDIFNILFGRIFVSSSGIMRIPIYSKVNVMIPVENGIARHYEEQTLSEPNFITIQLSETTSSSHNSPSLLATSPTVSAKPVRSSYLANRGIPPWSNVLFIIDACHSAHMTHFPFVYHTSEQKMTPSPFYNTFVHHVDMPHCVSISSCEVDKITKSPHEGSQLTQVLFSQLKDINTSLNFRQFYYYIVNTKNNMFKNYFISNTLTPVLSSTSNNVDLNVPFFGTDVIIKPKKIIK